MSIPEGPYHKELDEYVEGSPELVEIYRKAGYSRTAEKHSRELGEKIYRFVKSPKHGKVFLESLDKLEGLYKSEWNPLSDRMKREVVEQIATLKLSFLERDGIYDSEEEAEELKYTLDTIFDPPNLEKDFGNKKNELDSVVRAVFDFKKWEAKERTKALWQSAESPDYVLQELLRVAKIYSQSRWMHCSTLTVALLCGIVEAYAHPIKVSQDNILYIQQKLFIPGLIVCALAYFYPSWKYLAFLVLGWFLYSIFENWQFKKKAYPLYRLRAEIQTEGYDGNEIACRLQKLEADGIILPTIVYSLLRIEHKPFFA